MFTDTHYHTTTPPTVRLRVTLDGDILANTTSAVALTEVVRDKTMDPVYYVPRRDIAMDRLQSTDKLTRCPIKGHARYFSLRETNGDDPAPEIAWSYEDPVSDSEAIRDLIAFDVRHVTLEIDPT